MSRNQNYEEQNGEIHTTYIIVLDDIVFGVYCPTREFFTHMEMSLLLVKGCKFWPMLRTHGHWAVRVL